jgi:hypothetical protein
MFNNKDFSAEIEQSMESHLVGNGIEKQAEAINKFAAALDHLNAVAEIFDELGLRNEAEATTLLLEVVAKKKSKKSKKSKSKSRRKSKKSDPATKNLTPEKMLDNMKDHGSLFNADDNFADDGHHDSCMCSMCMDADDDHFDMGAYDVDDNYTNEYDKDEHEQDLARRFHDLLDEDEDFDDEEFDPAPRHAMLPPRGVEQREPNFRHFEPKTKNWNDILETRRDTVRPGRRR